MLKKTTNINIKVNKKHLGHRFRQVSKLMIHICYKILYTYINLRDFFYFAIFACPVLSKNHI